MAVRSLQVIRKGRIVVHNRRKVLVPPANVVGHRMNFTHVIDLHIEEIPLVGDQEGLPVLHARRPLGGV